MHPHPILLAFLLPILRFSEDSTPPGSKNEEPDPPGSITPYSITSQVSLELFYQAIFKEFKNFNVR